MSDPMVGEAENLDGAQESDAANSQRLMKLTSEAFGLFSQKKFEAAAELYAQASELQAEINGEMSLKNADLLYAYGKCLYQVAVKNSDVLGAKAGAESTDNIEKAVDKSDSVPEIATDRTPVESIVQRGATDKSKLLFQFTGDESWNSSDEGENGVEAEDAVNPPDPEDDFANAFEVLDMARVLFLRQVGNGTIGIDKVQAQGETKEMSLPARLADTYDLQAEISLESENFLEAVKDLRSALTLKEKLYAPSSSLIAEAHYKLSLALEFASVKPEQDTEEHAGEHIPSFTADYALRKAAASEMEAAISSCYERIAKEEMHLDSLKGGDPQAGGDAELLRKEGEIKEVKEMVVDMETRLKDLRQPFVSIHDRKSDPNTVTGASSASATALSSEISLELRKKRIDEMSKAATDLSALVKKRKINDSQQEATPSETEHKGSKRKIEASIDASQLTGDHIAKN